MNRFVFSSEQKIESKSIYKGWFISVMHPPEMVGLNREQSIHKLQQRAMDYAKFQLKANYCEWKLQNFWQDNKSLHLTTTAYYRS